MPAELARLLARAQSEKLSAPAQEAQEVPEATASEDGSVLFYIPLPLPPLVRALWTSLPAVLRRGIVRVVTRVLRTKLGERFAEAGPGWTPLAASTIKAKERAGLPKKGKNGRVLRRLRQANATGAETILIAGGTLRDSYRVKKHPDHVERITVDASGMPVLIIGSRVPYAAPHQSGSLRRVGNKTVALPMRAVRLTASDIAEAQQAAEDYLQQYLT